MKRLDEIEARLAAATPGEWAVWGFIDGQEVGGVETDALRGQPVAACLKRDAYFIANAPADLELLVGLVRSLVNERCAGPAGHAIAVPKRVECREMIPLAPQYWCCRCRIVHDLEGAR